jgi:hypothetical protein
MFPDGWCGLEAVGAGVDLLRVVRVVRGEDHVCITVPVPAAQAVGCRVLGGRRDDLFTP